MTGPISAGREPPHAAEHGAAADPRRRLAAHDDHLDVALARRLDDPGADERARTTDGRDLDRLVLARRSPWRAPAPRSAASARSVGGGASSGTVSGRSIT